MATSSDSLIKVKRIRWVLGLVIAATILNGLLAGGNVDRMLVATPAWGQIGLAAWADFSRHADLGNGIFVYPTMAIGGTFISIAAAVLFIYATHLRNRVSLPIIFAAALRLAALPFSLEATPFMMSLRHINAADMVALGDAFSGAHFWGRLQGIFHVAAFCANLWSIVAVSRYSETL